MCTLYRPQRRHQEDTKTRRKRTDRLPYQSHDHRPHGYEIPDTWYSVYLNVRATTTTKNNPTPLPGTVYYINTNNNQNRNHNHNKQYNNYTPIYDSSSNVHGSIHCSRPCYRCTPGWYRFVCRVHPYQRPG